MQYDRKEFTVKAGVPVEVLFINKTCPLPHNFILLKPGTDQAYGKAADDMILKDPVGALKAIYQPPSTDVLAKTSKLIGAGQHEVIKFTAPADPGDYPYICTYPGHRFLMKGVMHVREIAQPRGGRFPTVGPMNRGPWRRFPTVGPMNRPMDRE